MKIITIGKNVDVTPALKEYVEKKLSRLERIMAVDEGNVKLVVEGMLDKVEVTLKIGGYLLRGEESDNDMYAAVDLVVDKLETQLIKYKKKMISKRTRMEVEAADALITEEEIIDEDDLFASDLVRTKHFALKPMSLEEAILQMNMLGHNFFVYMDSETNTVCVVYLRNDGKYGLLEPEY